MKEYNWREEREKYKVPFMKKEEETGQTGSAKSAPPPSIQLVSSSGGIWKAIGIVVVLLLLGLVALVVLSFITGKGDSKAKPQNKGILVSNPNSVGGTSIAPLSQGQSLQETQNIERGDDSAILLQKAADRYKYAIGLVVFWAKLKNGNVFVHADGTAWACSRNQFATNAHVAKGMQQACQKILEPMVQKILLAEIAENEAKRKAKEEKKEEEARRKEEKKMLAKEESEGLEEEEEMSPKQKLVAFQEQIGETAFAEKVEAAFKQAREENIRDMGMEIRINQKSNVTMPVTYVQVHRKYGIEGTSYDPDVALLTVKTNLDDYFPIASKDCLRKLKQGMPVAFLGFPMENLAKGNVNLEAPGATMQTGIISAISDFDLKEAGFDGNYLLRHNLPSAGGASGSPMFNVKGEVVALLFGVNMDNVNPLLNGTGRTPNAAMVNFAVRVDLLEGVGEPVPIQQWLQDE